jgi:hypothetical protein
MVELRAGFPIWVPGCGRSIHGIGEGMVWHMTEASQGWDERTCDRYRDVREIQTKSQ